MTLLLVALGGALGAVVRHLVDRRLPIRPDGLPWGTFVVNIGGSLLLGLVAGGVAASDGPAWLLNLVGTGFCGALTTFATFGQQTLLLLGRPAPARAVGYLVASVAIGLAAAAAGWSLGESLGRA